MTIGRSKPSSPRGKQLQQRYSRLRRKKQQRELKLESLESRQLLAVGPQLAGIQPNAGALLQNGQVRTEAPRELIFHFNADESIDPRTVDGIRVTGSGFDGTFERAVAATDFNTNGAAVMEFTSRASLAGNGIRIEAIKNDLGAGVQPRVSVIDKTIHLELNTNPVTPTRAGQLANAINSHLIARTFVSASLRLGSNPNTNIAAPEINYSPLVLDGANRASVTSNLNSGSRLQVTFTATPQGASGNGIEIEFTSTDRGGVSPPRITVDQLEEKVLIDLNSNAAQPTTARELVETLNADPRASALVTATLDSGSPITPVGDRPINYSPLILRGANDANIVPGFVGLGDNPRQVVVRFEEPLPDDLYLVEIIGTGSGALRNVDGVAFGDDTDDNLDNGRDFSLRFELDLGTQIVAVVPQPVAREEGALQQSRDQIAIYFNDDDFFPAPVSTGDFSPNPTVVDPAFYQLIATSDTVQNTDDTVFFPQTISYDPGTDRAMLTFASDLDELGAGPGTFRLRVGTDEALPLVPIRTDTNDDPGSSFDTAVSVGTELLVIGDGLQVSSGQTFSLTNDAAETTTFTFDDGAGQGGTNLVVFDLGMDQQSLATAIAAAINQADIGIVAAIDGGDRLALTGARALTLGDGTTAFEVGSLNSLIISSEIEAKPYNLSFPGDDAEPGGRTIPSSIEQHLVGPADEEDGIKTIFYNFQEAIGADPQGNPLFNLITDTQKQRAREGFELYGDQIGVQFVESENQGFTIATGDMRAVAPGIPTGPGGVFSSSISLGPSFGIVVMDAAEDWDDTFGATDDPNKLSWFEHALKGIGTLLGIGLSSELPPLTLNSVTTLGENVLLFDNEGERVYPGNQDLVHARHLFRPEGQDIDLFEVEIPQNGLFSAQVIAERLPNSSLLNSVLTLYQQSPDGSRELIARNDDYFSNDPFLELELQPGTYWVGVSSTGNDDYDPVIEDSGFNGTTEGPYDLRLNFRADADRTLRDATGTDFDGDGDGVPGGVSNFWFKSDLANTLFVDKAASGPGDGSLANPFSRINTAFAAAATQAATEDDVIVRIVGNGGQDGLIETVEDNQAYEIGFNNQGNVLADGPTMNVPRGVTVMVDSGAIFKLRRARVAVGSSSITVDRSAAALQVLGTPILLDSAAEVVRDEVGNIIPGSVYFTSIHDEQIGRDTNPDRFPPDPAPGDWGGLSLRNDIDRRDANRTNLEGRGVFLNYINNAQLLFGGGSVVVDGIPQTIAPIHMTDARPTATFNTIRHSAVAAMSATPDSFLETHFHAPRFQFNPFTSDYQRIGPAVHGNITVDNSINGLFVRVSTPAGNRLRPLTVPGRWDDRDITHVLSERLVIEGTPGGPIQDVELPPVEIVVLRSQGNGELSGGAYNYRVTFVDDEGNEGAPSSPTTTINIAGSPNDNAIRLQNLPTAQTGFVARRIYRSSSTGIGPYTLVAEINANSTTFVDTGATVGGLLQVAPRGLRARTDARLAIDPGVVVKLQGGAIETRFGGQLIAEGLDGGEIIFTSSNDDRFGGSGSFDTTNNGIDIRPTPGDWGGIYVGHVSHASIDHARFAYGGGEVRVEGSFAGVNTIEVHQAEARVAHSVFEQNADGTGGQATPGRGGRGSNADGVIFIRGAQPVILQNVMQDNLGPVINVGANALNADHVTDPGRTTFNRGEDTASPLDRTPGFGDNEGPLIRLNRVGNNGLNGMVVRGSTLTTQSVWDDTDLVHIVREDTIYVPDFHTFGGLRLESSPSESLVVKLHGSQAGFTATGRPLDINDRIGGSLHIIGQPAKPVVLTSLSDDSVGAGFQPDGTPQTDTANDGDLDSETGILPTGPEVNRGLLIDNDVDSRLVGHFEAEPAAGGDFVVGALDGVTVQGLTQLATNQDFIFEFLNFIDVDSNGGAVELSSTTITTPPTLVADDVVISEGTFTGDNALVNWTARTTFVDGAPVLFNEITFSSLQPLGDLRYISYLDEDVLDIDDDILWPSGTPGEDDFRLFTLDNPERFGFSHGGAYNPGPGLLNATYDGWAADKFSDLRNIISGNGTAYSIPGTIDLTDLPPTIDPNLGQIYGEGGGSQLGADVTTAHAWTVDPDANTATIRTFLELVAGNSIVGGSKPGDWRSVTIDAFANDRNVAIVTELEPSSAASTAAEALQNSEFVGALAPHEKAGDESLRLGFEIHGLLSKPSDVDVYAFDAPAGTEVFFDIDRTHFALDSVVELIDANGQALARSDNGPAETDDPNLLYHLPEVLPAHHVNPLAKLAFEIPDRYTTNPKDAGMRVVLPGAPGSTNTYYARVRSSSPSLELDQGLTMGDYQLQVRLGELDEAPGSTVRFADIRFATNGIEVLGQPAHSPLLGEATEEINPLDGSDTNDSLATAQDLGNLLNTDRGTLGLAGNIELPSDVDWFRFELDFDSATQQGIEVGSFIFDVDYADGLARANTNLWLFDEQGNLIMSARDSNIAEDRPGPLQRSDLDDLSRGSVGPLDPYLGPVELPVNDRLLSNGVYYVAVSSNAVIPQELEQFTQAIPTNPLFRLEPVNSLNRIAEDRLEGTPTGNNKSNLARLAEVPVLFDEESALPMNLGDVTLFVTQRTELNQTALVMVDAFTGETEAIVGNINGNLEDVAMHPNDGHLYAYNSFFGLSNDSNTGIYHQIQPRSLPSGVPSPFSTTTESLSLTLGNAGIETHNLRPDDESGGSTERSPEGNDNSGVGVHFDALTIGENPGQDQTEGIAGYAIGRRAENFGVTNTDNLLYEFIPSTGVAISANPPGNRAGCNPNNPPINPLCAGAFTNIVERAALDTEVDGGPGGAITGMAFVGTDLYAVSNAGGLYQISFPDTNFASITWLESSRELTFADGDAAIEFMGLTAGPPNAEGGRYSNMLFGIDARGRMWAFNTAGQLQPVFADGQTNVPTGLSGVTGLAFSNLDFNLWHVTDTRAADPGHGVDPLFDGSRLGEDPLFNNSIYFGYESAELNLIPENEFTNPLNVNDYDFAGGALGTVVSNPFSLSGYSREDRPTLYFNYFLDTENANAGEPADLPLMRDSLRAYMSGDDGVWHLLATNNSEIVDTTQDFPPNDEFDDPNRADSVDVDVQELYDIEDGPNGGAPISWRQARIPLDDFAGESNLLLRFDFSTAGGIGPANSELRGKIIGDELRTIAADRLFDGQVIFINDGQGPGDPFEIDFGFTINAPTGAAIPDNSSFNIDGLVYLFDSDGFLDGNIQAVAGDRVGDGATFQVSDGSTTVTFEFEDLSVSDPDGVEPDNVPVGYGVFDPPDFVAVAIADAINRSDLSLSATANGLVVMLEGGSPSFAPGKTGLKPPNEIVIRTTDNQSSAEVAANIEEAIFNDPPPVGSQVYRSGHRINLPDSTEITPNNLPANFIQGTPGVLRGEPVSLNMNMDATEVAGAMVASLADFFAEGSRPVFKTYENVIEMPQHAVASQELGPFGAEVLGVATSLFGDEFGAFEASALIDGTVDLLNPSAQRAQDNAHEGAYIDDVIIGFAEHGEMVTGAVGNTDFIRNSRQLPFEIDQGPYQLEIRRGPEFGIPDPPPAPTLVFERGFNTNDRLTEQVSLEIPGGDAIADGQVVTLSDGVDTLTFEFDDLNLPPGNPHIGVVPGRVRIPFVASQSANEIAELVRDTINSVQSQSVLDITAGLSDGVVTGGNSTSTRINLYGNAITNSAEVAGAINNVPALGSTDLFSFSNLSASDQITSITVTLQDPSFFSYLEPFFPPDHPFNADRSGPDISPDSDPVGASFSFQSVFATDDRITIEFEEFDPGEEFVFGVDIDPSNNPAALVGAEYEIEFSNGRSFTGVFTDEGAVPGVQVAILDLANNLNRIRFTDFGDTNTVREQGQIVIEANSITNSLEYGILSDAADRDISDLADMSGQFPHAGPVRVTGKLNAERLVTGVTIANNLLVNGGRGGIHFSGDPNLPGQQLASVPFGRIVNNTIVGREQMGVGIDVDEFVSPTLLNNVLADLEIGIQVDPTSNTTVVGGTVYQENARNTVGVGLGSFPIQLTDADPLFVDAASGNYYLAAGSPAIDSAIDSLQDRPQLQSVRESLGMSSSPILAPDIDLIGQNRADDPTVDTPPGQGANVFKDRGALDRSDFAGPSAVLTTPQDNDSLGRDMNPDATVVELVNAVLPNFSIQLLDGVEPNDPQQGTGPDDSTVRGERVTVKRDNEELEQGVDFSFNYDATNNIIRITPLAGIWEPDHVYEIELSNSKGIVITAPSGTEVNDGDQFTAVDEEGNRVTFEYDSGYSLQVPQTLTLQVPAGGGAVIGDAEFITITENDTAFLFEFDNNNDFVDEDLDNRPDNNLITFSDLDTANDIANKLVTAIQTTSLNLRPVNTVNFFGRAVHLGSRSIHTLDTSRTSLVQTGQAGGIEEGQSFTVDDGTKVVTFQFSLGGGSSSPTLVPIPFDYSQTHEQIASAVATAIQSAGLGLSGPTGAHYELNSDGLVNVGGGRNHVINTAPMEEPENNSKLILTGSPGAQPEFGIRITPTLADRPDFETIMDGESFSVSRGGQTITFELDEDGQTAPGNRVVTFNSNTTTSQLADAISVAIRRANLGLVPTNEGSGFIALNNATAAFSLNMSNTSFVQVGVAGEPAARPVTFRPGSFYPTGVPRLDPIFTDVQMAESIAAAVNAARAEGLFFEEVVATAREDQVTLRGIEDTDATGSVTRAEIRDIAGNKLKPNRSDGTTRFTVFIGTGQDYGDAPAPYPTLAAENGARHEVFGDFFLGERVDADIDGQPSINADGDDNDSSTSDEDGVLFDNGLFGGASAQITVTASKDGMLDGWIDFNRDGDWSDPGEQVFSSQPLTVGVNPLLITVPGVAVDGETYARFRLSSRGGLGFAGPADDGEVEDHRIVIQGNPWRNGINPLDVNNDGSVSPIDALLVINELNRRVRQELPFDLPIPLPPDMPAPPPFFDVDGNAMINPKDAGDVVGHLNRMARGEGESASRPVFVSNALADAEGEFAHVVLVDHRLPALSPAQSASRQSAAAAPANPWLQLDRWYNQVDQASGSNERTDERGSLDLDPMEDLVDELATGIEDADSRDEFFANF